MKILKYQGKIVTFGGSFLGNAPIVVITSNIKYGRLYNQHATADSLFAPTGWHVPTQTEFDTLITELGGTSIAGGKLKENNLSYWDSPNTDATNETGFFARGSGYRTLTGQMLYLKQRFLLWTSTVNNPGISYYAYLTQYNAASFLSGNYNVKTGATIRLIKDDSTLVPSFTDLDGNIYRTAKIGNQVWLADNWACTKLNNGTNIPEVTDNTAWGALTTMGRCNYANNIANVFLP